MDDKYRIATNEDFHVNMIRAYGMNFWSLNFKNEFEDWPYKFTEDTDVEKLVEAIKQQRIYVSIDHNPINHIKLNQAA